MTTSATRYLTFVGVTPGLEEALAAELEALELGAPKRLEGGVELRVPREGLWRVARWSRLAESLRVRVGRFEAKSFAELEDRLGRLPWAAYLPGAGGEVRATCRKSRLYHSDAVVERARRVLQGRLGSSAPGPAVHLRLDHDEVTVSVDAAGERLHKRGWRQDVGAAPLRETLAAACLRLSGWAPGQTLWDPFCGSGTLVVEAAAMAAGLPAPTAERGFAFELWPTHDAAAYAAFVGAEPPPRPAGLVATGSDLNPAEIEAARRNAERAGVTAHVSLLAGDVAEAGKQVGPVDFIVSNLPYGERTRAVDLQDAWRRLGQAVKTRQGQGLRGAALLTGADTAERLARSAGLALRPLARFSNRGLPVVLLGLGRP